jgi:arsenite methyltransferase
LAERVFARKLHKAGFLDMRFRARSAFGIDDCAVLPLFTPELIELMRRLIPAERQHSVAMSLIVSAVKPPAEPARPRGSA